MTSIKEPIVRHIENNFFKYIIVLAFFVAGVIFGVVNSFGVATESTASEFVSLFENVQEADFDTVQIMKTSFFKNLRYFFLIFIGGFSWWLLPFSFSALFTCGFSYGYTVTCMTANVGGVGFVISFVSIISGLLITVPLCTILCVIAINRNLYKKRNRSDSDLTGYVICNVVLFVINLAVVPADALLIPEFIRQICVSVKI